MSLDGRQLGRYHLLHILGRGAMGEVYLAEDAGINRQVAIKVIRTDTAFEVGTDSTSEATRLFQREMKAIARLNHPHILPLYDYGQETNNNTILPYMVMPFCANGSLATWLRQRSTNSPLASADVASIIVQAASALQHAHDQHIIHRDVKPSNFLIRHNKEMPQRPDLLLADFGLAKFNDSASSIGHQTLGGTPLYMAPEQWKGYPVLATDQYMLAAMSYEMLTGHTPFRGNLQQLMMQHVQGQLEPPSMLNPQVSPALDIVMLRALAKRPEERFPSVAAFAQAFQAASQTTHMLPNPSYRTLHIDAEKTQPLVDIASPHSDAKVSQTPPQNPQSSQPIEIDTSHQRVQEMPGNSRQQVAQTDPQRRGINFQLATRSGLRCSVVLMLGLLIFVGAGVLLTSLQVQYAARPTSGSIPRPAVTSTTIASATQPPLATATASAASPIAGQTNPYPPHTGTLVLNDPLQNNGKGNKWDESSNAQGKCTFMGGAYHVSVATNILYDCFAQNTNYQNFTYEVDMNILQGFCGALLFRANVANGSYYRLLICQDGSYGLTTNGQVGSIAQGSSPYIHTGINQHNLIAVIANGSSISLYANNQFITTATDSTYARGQIGLGSFSNGSPNEVVYSNVRVWTF